MSNEVSLKIKFENDKTSKTCDLNFLFKPRTDFINIFVKRLLCVMICVWHILHNSAHLGHIHARIKTISLRTSEQSIYIYIYIYRAYDDLMTYSVYSMPSMSLHFQANLRAMMNLIQICRDTYVCKNVSLSISRDLFYQQGLPKSASGSEHGWLSTSRWKIPPCPYINGGLVEIRERRSNCTTRTILDVHSLHLR